jgi:large subunit ribosomal protein L6
MSRIGKKVIEIPANVEIKYDQETKSIVVKGPIGQLQKTLHSCVILKIENNQITIDVENSEDKKQRSIWGTTRQIIDNMVVGVSKGFEKSLELNGVGFKWEVSGEKLVLNIGFSHPVNIQIPTGLKLTINKNLMTGTCFDKELIGDFFGHIHDMKPCDPYKQKGFKFPGRFYRKKVVKKTK